MKNIISANRKNATLFEAEFGKIDIIYVHVGYPAGYIAMKLSKERSCPYVISEHMGPFPFSSYLNLWEKPMQKLVDAYKNAAQVLAVSTAMKNVIEEKIGFKAVVLHNFIDEHLFKISEKPVPKKILFVGRAEYSKGLDLLIRAFHLSKASSAGYQLYIIGKGSIKDSYNNEPLPEVHFFGELPNTQIANIISESAFLVLPSLFESFGVVLIEALACGKPVVATDCGGPSDIVTATNGVLAKTGDVADLQEKLDWMIDHHHSFDPKAIRAEFLEKFGAKKITSHLMARFKEAIVKFESQNNL
jgi:glycosyltransferase involved in cell wall biosynthesis